MPELNTIAPKKWFGDFGGVSPTLNRTSDDIRVGDLAVDSITSKPWVCTDENTPEWTPLGAGRNETDVYYISSSNTISTPIVNGGVYYLDSDSGEIDLYIADSTPGNEGLVLEFRKPNLTGSYNAINIRTVSGQKIGQSSVFTLRKPGESASIVANNFVAGGNPGRKWRFIHTVLSNPNIITVGPTGEQFTDIESAVTFANSFGFGETVIAIQTGEYEISSTMTITNSSIKTILGTSNGSVVIKPTLGLVGSAVFDCQVPIEIRGIKFNATDIPTYKTTSGGSAIELKGNGGFSKVRDCVFIKYNMGISIHGLQLGGTTQSALVESCRFERCTHSIDADSGTSCIFHYNDIIVDVEGAYSIYIHNSTSQGITKVTIQNLTINNLDIGSYNGEGVKVSDNSIFYMNGFEFYGFQEGVHINNGSSVLCAINNGVITSMLNYAVKVEGESNLGVNSISVDGCEVAIDVGLDGLGNNLVYGFGLFVNNSTTYDLVQRNSTDVFRIYNSLFDRTKLSISNATNMELMFFDQQDGDRGLKIYGELAVGSPEIGKESVMGGGDSYTRGMLVYTYDDGTGTYTDVSTEASSISGSTFTFTGTDENDAIYLSSDLIGVDSGDYLLHLGIKASINEAAVLGSGSIVAEYWDGSAWEEISTMSTKSGSPYYSYSNNLFSTPESHQIRYNNNLDDTVWDKNDPPSTGTNRRWARFRIVGGITTAPVFEQFKLHTSRTEINSDGFVEFFGKARPVDTLPWDISMIRPAESSPGNQDLYVSKNIVIGREYNLLGDNDKVGFMRTLPQSLDTSTPIRLKISFVSETSDTVHWKLFWAYTISGDNVYTDSASSPSVADSEQNYEFSVVAVAGKETWFEVEMDVSGLTSFPSSGLPDNLWINLQKISGDGVVALIDIDAQYTMWSNGGRSD